MVDFWMTVGRVLTNETVLNTLMAALPARDYPIDVTLRGFRFTPADYDRARTALREGLTAAGLPVYPVSLMTLGELLYASSDAAEHSTLRTAMQMMNAQFVDSSREPMFYAALGGAMVDDEIRKMFIDGRFDDAMFGTLTGPDRLTLAKFSAHPEFIRLSRQFCGRLWTWDCNIKGVFRVDQRYPASAEQYAQDYVSPIWQHLHPAAPQAVDRFVRLSPLAKAAAASGSGVEAGVPALQPTY